MRTSKAWRRSRSWWQSSARPDRLQEERSDANRAQRRRQLPATVEPRGHREQRARSVGNRGGGGAGQDASQGRSRRTPGEGRGVAKTRRQMLPVPDAAPAPELCRGPEGHRSLLREANAEAEARAQRQQVQPASVRWIAPRSRRAPQRGGCSTLIRARPRCTGACRLLTPAPVPMLCCQRLTIEKSWRIR